MAFTNPILARTGGSRPILLRNSNTLQLRNSAEFFRGLDAAAYGHTNRTEEAQSETVLFVEERRKRLAKGGRSRPVSDLELVTERFGRFKRQVDQDR